MCRRYAAHALDKMTRVCKQGGACGQKSYLIGVTVALMAVTAAVAFTLSYQFAMQRFNDTMANVNERQAMYGKLSEVKCAPKLPG